MHCLILIQTLLLLANKSSTARDILSRVQLAYENLPKWMQQGVINWNKGNIELENKSTIVAAATSSSAIRGGSYNIIFLDEYAFVPANIAEMFFSCCLSYNLLWSKNKNDYCINTLWYESILQIMDRRREW